MPTSARREGVSSLLSASLSVSAQRPYYLRSAYPEECLHDRTVSVVRRQSQSIIYEVSAIDGVWRAPLLLSEQLLKSVALYLPLFFPLLAYLWVDGIALHLLKRNFEIAAHVK